MSARFVVSWNGEDGNRQSRRMLDATLALNLADDLSYNQANMPIMVERTETILEYFE